MEKVGEALREKILIVQDAPSFHTAKPDLLHRSGYATALVQERSRALDKLGQESPDLVILDFGHVSSEGLSLLSRIKSDRFSQHLPVLVAGCSGQIADRISWINSGADDCLDYTCSPVVLYAHIVALLRRSIVHDPITGLPTGAYLQRQVDGWLAKNIPTAILYVDVDHLVSYESAYGQEAGKLVLQYLARLIVDVLPSGILSIAHLGEDDFMMAFRPLGVQTFAQTLVDRFAAAQNQFYDKTDFAKGYIPETNPKLPPRMWPLMTLSAALVTNENRPLVSFLQASSVLAKLMLKVKERGGDQVRGENF